MNYSQAKTLEPNEFQHLCGVSPQKFDRMVETVKYYDNLKKKQGRPSKLTIEDRVLMTLEYLRENRTYFNIGKSWGLDKSNVYRTIKKIENILIENQDFRIAGKLSY